MNTAEVAGRVFTRKADVLLAVLVLAIVGMMIVPLPTFVIDALIAANLTLAILLLATALYMRDALSFASFPTLILIATLYRLALNVSSTRLILLQADAGRIIEAFGSFVVRGDYAVGALVFVVITLIQFLVIARGAERVAEVGARFSLDAMPGKQMAIDAELRAGTLSADGARSARRRLERESQLYGAMDGAMKFVKGDAIAGIVITLINFVGGVALGATARGLDFTTSLKTYGLLTIGDGLVTQIPSLLGSTAAALAVTRVTSDQQDGSLGSDIAQQLLTDVRVLSAAVLVLSVLTLVPGIPGWPFALMAIVCAGLAVRAQRVSELGTQQRQVRHDFELALGSKLAESWLPKGRPSKPLLAALMDASSASQQRTGVSVSAITPVLDASLPEYAYCVRVRDLPEPAVLLGAESQALPQLSFDLSHLPERYPQVCLSQAEVERRLDALEQQEPGLLRRLTSLGITSALLTDVLRRLLREGVNVAHLSEIVAALPTQPQTSPIDVPALVEGVRAGLSRRICHGIAPQGELHLLRLDPMLEETLLDAVTREGQQEWLALGPGLAREIEQAIAAAAKAVPEPRALVTSSRLRRHVLSLIEHVAPDLSVLSAHELAPSLRVLTTRVISP